ncbi:uncharacterized protein LOC132030002 [Lycium ferocissimum]|uniref:uncharacterized protein LOC132030002 n=1 Tax=Lycium ferocissimum TaxID=112874 RepID=UPI002814F534|nr:uncharacterized protein LOC132030002 [Lycium ferocissimum]
MLRVCEFEVEITYGSGTIVARVPEKLTERMLSMTAEQVYETTVIKKQLLPVEHIREELLHKYFKIHLQNSVLWIPDGTPGSLVVLSYSQKQTMFDSLHCSTLITIGEGTKRKKDRFYHFYRRRYHFINKRCVVEQKIKKALKEADFDQHL